MDLQVGAIAPHGGRLPWKVFEDLTVPASCSE